MKEFTIRYDQSMKLPELLMPAGSYESLKAAVENGADAVYLGGHKFSARNYAENFSTEQLLSAIDFAHQRDVAAYITVNTLIKESELKNAVGYLDLLYGHGADAVIVQDLGLLNILRRQMPDLPVHASTQMTVHNTAGAELMASAGVKRVVLARELNIDEIRSIRNCTGIQLEVFIHGALCISYSGRCLMSSFIGGRSGNRGYCAQPCRRRYTMEGEQGYLLSTRDLNLSLHLADLMEAGVDSFKIEGRMKSPEYVAVVTRTYRNILNRLADDIDAVISDDENKRLESIFSRGFTEGYIHGDPGPSSMSMDMPGKRGMLVGRVSGYDHKDHTVSVILESPVNVNDGIMIGDTGATIHVMRVNGKNVDLAPAGTAVSIPSKRAAAPGTPVYRTFDHQLIESARRSCRSPERRVPVSIEVEARLGLPLMMRMHDELGNTGQAFSDIDISAARQSPLNSMTLLSQINKLGDTVFKSGTVDIHMDNDIFLPLGAVNAVRREAAARLADARIRRFRRDCVHTNVPPVRTADVMKIPHLSVRVEGPALGNAAITAGADRVYLDLEGILHDVPAANAFIGTAHEAGRTVYVRLPDIIKDGEMNLVMDCFDDLLGPDGILAAGPDQISLLRDRYDLPVAVDYPSNVFNRNTLEFLTGLGAYNSITVSPELTLNEIKSISVGFELECIVQGAVQLMISEHCLAAGGCEGIQTSLKDEKGYSFPVKYDTWCRTRIFNSRELCLIDRVPEILDAGVSSLRIEAVNYDIRQVEEVTSLYRRALDDLNNGEFDGQRYLSQIKEMFPAGLTTGHYFRGVE